MASRTLLSLVFLTFLFASCSIVTPRPLPKVPTSFPIESAIVVPSGGGGGGGISPPAGDIGGTTGSPTVVSTHLSSPLPVAQGGTATAYGQPASNELGTITNGGNITCNFASTWTCHFTLASPSNAFTFVCPTNLPTSGIVTISFAQAATGFPTITWPAGCFYGYDAKSGANAYVDISANASDFNFPFFANATTGNATSVWQSDGTHLSLISGTSMNGQFSTLNVQGASNFRSSLTLTGSANLIINSGNQVQLTAGGIISATGGTAPTATCSGGSTGVSIAAGSTNNRGQITTSSSASTNCTITWSAASTWPQAPFCTVTDGAASITPTGVSVGATGTSTMVIDFASATSKVFNWLCM